MRTWLRTRFGVWLLASAGLFLLASSAQAYELRLVRAIDGAFGSSPGLIIVADAPFTTIGDLVSYDVYLDTQGQSNIILFSASLTYDPSVVNYRPDLSDAEDYYPLYSPAVGKGNPTWLVPATDPPGLWPSPPPGLEQINVDFLEVNLNPTTATATDQYLGTLTFELVGPGTSAMSWSLDNEGNIFVVDQVGIQTDIAPQVSMVVVWAPEPTAALLVGMGLAGLGLRARRR